MQREELEKRLDELKKLFFAYHKMPPSRENNEAIAELSIEIRQIYDLLRPVGGDNPSPAPRASTPVAAAEYPGGNFTGERINSDIAFELGFTVRDLTPQLAANLQARGGVLVSKVTKDSPADRAGLQAGDVIVGAQGRVVMSAAQLQAFLSNQRGATTLKIVRKKEAVVVSLNLQ
jgi:membrane-associated protease RseP (regulator of RpoE activity)